MEKKYLGMEKKVCFGLSYIFPIIAIILLIADKDLTKEEKQICVAIIFSILASSITCSIYFILNIIAAVKAFGDDYSFKLWGCQQIAEAIIK